MPTALAAMLRNAPLSPEKVAFAWHTSVGPSMSNGSSVDLREGILHVRAKDTAWRREIERSAGLIRARLDTLLGEGVVRELRVTLSEA